MTSRDLRVAAAQFSTGTDVESNLATTLRMIAAAADDGARLIVCPEFCNHLSIYDDADHAWRVAVDPGGDFIAEVAALAATLGVWTQFNVTVRRGNPASEERWITNTNVVVNPDGRVAGTADKTVLMGAEGDYLTPASTPSAAIVSPFGLLGSYACMDGIVPEVPRAMAARGARILMNSLNSFALDEASLHVPVRAAENRAWVIACCKVGPLLPPDKTEMFSSMLGIPAEALNGAGESQIVAPDGTVVAIGPREGEAVVVADIDLGRVNAVRPDGTDVWAVRRPVLYAPLAAATPPLDDHPRAERIAVATARSLGDLDELLEVSPGSMAPDLIVLPELSLQVEDLAAVQERLIGDAAATVVVCSVREDAAHVGVAIGAGGVLGRQPQLHSTARHHWATRLGNGIEPIDLPWGRLAIVVGDDLVHPESTRLAALQSVDVVAIPFSSLEAWETQLGVAERAAENRICVVASNAAGESVVADLPPDFTLWANTRERPFDGTINRPDLTRGVEPITADVHPARSVHRQISKATNLVDGRPWEVCGSLLD